MPTLYVETNFLVAIATGRDGRAPEILDAPPAGFRVAMPGLCLFEAMKWIEGEVRRQNDFLNSVGKRIADLARYRHSLAAPVASTHLRDAKLASESFREEVEARLSRAVRLASTRIDLLPLTPTVIALCQDSLLIEALPDNLILHIILESVGTSEETTNALLTDNYTEFFAGPARDALDEANVKMFRNGEDFLGWASSLPPSP